MTVREALNRGMAFLTRAEADTPYLDACLLLAETLKLSKEALIGAYPEEIDSGAVDRFEGLLRRRADGIPVSYLRRRKEFYGLEFYVDERVLVPRPDTETLVEEARALMESRRFRRVLDLCAGSGCLAIALKRLFPEMEIAGADVSPGAGDVFRFNAVTLLGAPLDFFESDLFADVPGTFDLVLSNPPYVGSAEVEAMKRSGWPEPALALDGGPDGTDFHFRIIENAVERLAPGGSLLLEADPGQIDKLSLEMERLGYINVHTRRDLGGRERVLCGRKPES
ncbi:MAG: peptide chain release factor N(5)-glutamine methyltransferase [Spirochaetales bacterium]|nr:peptide chain release factor N(5)-glutamine methyltransferase [Spirochaetales bacterium]